MTTLPTVADFDAGAVPPWSMIRTMPAEARGVAHSLFDTLTANRMIVLRSGTHMLTDAEVATLKRKPGRAGPHAARDRAIGLCRAG